MINFVRKFCLTPLFYVSSFLFTIFASMNIVKADTTIDLTNYDFSFMSDINNLVTKVNDASLGNNWILVKYKNGNVYRYLVYWKQSGTFSTQPQGSYDALITNNISLPMIICFSSNLQYFSRAYCDFSYSAYNFMDISQVLGGSSTSQLLYTPASINWNSNSQPISLYVFTYNNFSFTYNPLTDELPTLSSLYDYFTSQPTPPPDNTPVLTEFVDLSLDKLALICEFFTSSYVYLCIFVVFLLYFIIYLFRRLSQ